MISQPQIRTIKNKYLPETVELLTALGNEFSSLAPLHLAAGQDNSDTIKTELNSKFKDSSTKITDAIIYIRRLYLELKSLNTAGTINDNNADNTINRLTVSTISLYQELTAQAEQITNNEIMLNYDVAQKRYAIIYTHARFSAEVIKNIGATLQNYTEQHVSTTEELVLLGLKRANVAKVQEGKFPILADQVKLDTQLQSYSAQLEQIEQQLMTAHNKRIETEEAAYSSRDAAETDVTDTISFATEQVKKNDLRKEQKRQLALDYPYIKPSSHSTSASSSFSGYTPAAPAASESILLLGSPESAPAPQPITAKSIASSVIIVTTCAMIGVIAAVLLLNPLIIGVGTILGMAAFGITGGLIGAGIGTAINWLLNKSPNMAKGNEFQRLFQNNDAHQFDIDMNSQITLHQQPKPPAAVVVPSKTQ